jgi:pantetheine-phosphate adenylyltransferase
MGHLSLVERGLFLFDKIIVAVARNSAKAALFSVEERVEMLRDSLSGYDPARVEVDSFEGLLVEYARERQATALLRGLRATADFEYEFQMAMVNRHLEESVQSVFLMTDYRWLYISSTIVKEAASYGADVSAMVPPPVAACLQKKFQQRG